MFGPVTTTIFDASERKMLLAWTSKNFLSQNDYFVFYSELCKVFRPEYSGCYRQNINLPQTHCVHFQGWGVFLNQLPMDHHLQNI